MKTLIIVILTCMMSIGDISAQVAGAKADSVSIPKTLDTALISLDSIFPDSLKVKIRTMSEQEFGGTYHFYLGMSMRNSWGLWQGSDLAKYFNALGIHHPDDMSGIIFCSSHRKLLGKDLDVSSQVKYYQQYWRVNRIPDSTMYPKNVKKLVFNSSYSYETKEGLPGAAHLGRGKGIGNTWLFDYYLGWTKVNENDLIELARHVEDRAEFLTKLFATRK